MLSDILFIFLNTRLISDTSVGLFFFSFFMHLCVCFMNLFALEGGVLKTSLRCQQTPEVLIELSNFNFCSLPYTLI